MQPDEYENLNKYTDKHKLPDNLAKIEYACTTAVTPVMFLLNSIKDEQTKRFILTTMIAGMICGCSKNIDDNFTILEEVRENLKEIDRVVCKGDI
jgi:hypothetical protein